MQNFPEPNEFFNNSFDLQQTLQEIFILLGRLAEIYCKEFPRILPNELLQYSHGVGLFTDVTIKQLHMQPHDWIAIQSAFNSELSAIMLNFVNVCKQDQDFLVKHNQDFSKQFSHEAWKSHPIFHQMQQLYLLVKKYSLQWIKLHPGLNHKTKEQLHFYVNNILNMLAPTNTVWTNPEVLESLISSGGKTLIRGFRNYLDDLVINKGQFNVRMTDMRAFSVGVNLATTPGKVILQNDLIQLIQYEPATNEVQQVPILIIPPWINKYYVLDLSEKNSLVKWLVAQGYTVYMISWVNPGAECADKSFADYMQEGPLNSLDIITKTTGVKKVHMVGYCIGGTLLACTLAYMRAKGDDRALSGTFLMSLMNFSDPGEIGVFLDKPQIEALDKMMQARGYLNGHLLDMSFNLLRSNDLIWPYFINNYLLGKPTKPFDILYWNADSTNLPYKMYSFYLHNMYLENNLIKANKIILKDVAINLENITMPTFFLAAEQDHITMWKSIYSGLRYLPGEVEFVLTESGHVRGVVNPPGDTKYNYRINPEFTAGADYAHKSSHWIAGAIQEKGSWWNHWLHWLKKHNNETVEPRAIPEDMVIEDAPGSYVMKRL